MTFLQARCPYRRSASYIKAQNATMKYNEIIYLSKKLINLNDFRSISTVKRKMTNMQQFVS